MGITRDVIEGVGPDGVDVRLYSRGNIDLPSVTTILKTRDDDKSNLHDWQDRNDGEGDNAYHEYLFWYSRHLGTLGHWYALSQLDGSLDWTNDEGASLWALQHIDAINSDRDIQARDPLTHEPMVVDGSNHTEIHDASSKDVLYSIIKSQHSVESWGEFYDTYPPYKNHSFYNDALLDVTEDNIEFFVDGQQRLWSKLNIDDENVVTVEQYLFNEDVGYAGQVDLVYRDDRGMVVVADLKSSSGCYDKHQIQGAAYAKAVEQASNGPDHVDRLEVHRAHPRSGQVAAHTHRDAPGKKAVHTTKYWNDSYDSLWQDFKTLAEDFEYTDT